jgi:hypothetical protein
MVMVMVMVIHAVYREIDTQIVKCVKRNTLWVQFQSFTQRNAPFHRFSIRRRICRRHCHGRAHVIDEWQWLSEEEEIDGGTRDIVGKRLQLIGFNEARGLEGIPVEISATALPFSVFPFTSILVASSKEKSTWKSSLAATQRKRRMNPRFVFIVMEPRMSSQRLLLRRIIILTNQFH